MSQFSDDEYDYDKPVTTRSVLSQEQQLAKQALRESALRKEEEKN